MTDRDFEVVDKKQQSPSGEHSEHTQDADTFLRLPDWKGVDGALYMTLAKDDQGTRKARTLGIDCKGTRLCEKLVAVPRETQPTEKILSLESTSFKDVFLMGCELFKRYLYFGVEWQREMLVLASQSTYYRDLFYAFPYIDFAAPHYGCGKTTGMMCVCWSSAYGSCVTDPTEAVIYRYIEDSHAVLGFDELDNTLTNPDSQRPILSILNASYRSGLPCPRVDPITNEVHFYDAFGMKVFTHVKEIPKSLTNRSIVFYMVQSPHDLPEVKSPEQFREFRDLMYWLKLHQSETVEQAYAFVERDCGLKNRGKEKFLPSLTLAYCVGPDVYERTKQFAIQYMAGSVNEGFDDWQITLVEACRNILERDNLTGERRREVKLTDIAKEFNILAVKRDLLSTNEDGSSREVRSRTIKRMLEPYNIHPTPNRTHGFTYILLDADKIMPWASIYSVDTSLTSLTSPTGEVPPQKGDDSEDSEASEGGVTVE